MGIIYDGQIRMAYLAIVGGHSVNGVAALHTQILKTDVLKDFYEMMPEKFNNKTNGITQRRFLLHGNPLLADWVTEHAGEEWMTDLSTISALKLYVDDERAQQEFLRIKFRNKQRLAEYIQEHNGIDVDPYSIFDVQVKRLHEYKRQLLNILHVMYLRNRLLENPNMEFYPRTFIFGLSSDQVINFEHNGGYNPNDIFNNDHEIRQVLVQLVNGTFDKDTELFRPIYDSLLTNRFGPADRYFILADFRSYAEAQTRVEKAYRDRKGWARMAMMNTACAGKFSSDRTIKEYVDEIWHLDSVNGK